VIGCSPQRVRNDELVFCDFNIRILDTVVGGPFLSSFPASCSHSLFFDSQS
jgi:hypothetical protein